MIDKEAISKINNAVDIVAVIRDFEPVLKKSGTNYECLCPFHEDRHIGSFSISPRRNMCYCFSCGKGGDAIYYLMEAQKMSYPDALRYLGQKYNIDVEGMDKFKAVPKAKPREMSVEDNLPVRYLPEELYQRSTHGLNDDVLVQWLYRHKWDDAQRERIPYLLKEYHVGTATTKRGEQFTIFWYVDENKRYCTGKMIRYQCDGHRYKPIGRKDYVSDWVHAWLYRSPASPWYDRDRNDWKRTYYGMHLLDTFPNADVAIVESEKTALIMSIACGIHVNKIWMACGSKNNLTREKLMPIIERNRYIILYPDRDAISDWEDTSKAIGYPRLSVDTSPVTDYWHPEDGERADIADVVMRMIDTDDNNNI